MRTNKNKNDLTEKKGVFVILTKNDTGYREAVEINRIKHIEEAESNMTKIYTQYDVRTGEIYGHIVKESFEAVMNLLKPFVEVRK